MQILPPAGVGEAELLGGGGDAVGGAIAGELGQKLIVLGGEVGLFLLQRRDLIARLGGGGRLRNQQQGCCDQRYRALHRCNLERQSHLENGRRRPFAVFDAEFRGRNRIATDV